MNEPQYVYVALIDVLGYKKFLEKDRKSGSLEFKDKLTDALKIFNKLEDESVLQVQAISDTIIITCFKHDKLLIFFNALRSIFISFLKEGLFIRGAIAYSRHFTNNYLTYSHAIARAHELEKNSAIYPRIVIDQNIIEMYKAGSGLPDIFSSGYICVENGVYFLQILTEKNWSEVYNLASEIYNQDKDQLYLDEAAFNKHLRFQTYVIDSEFNVDGKGAYIPRISSVK